MKLFSRKTGNSFMALSLSIMLFFFPLLDTQLLAGSSFLRSLGDILEMVQQADQILWLLGDPAAERRFGYLMSRFMLAFHKPDRNTARNRWVKKVFQRVVEPGRRSKFQYRIYLLKNNEINAFALPGGYVFICKGMLDFVKSDDELACVIAHELAHINRRHSLNRLRRNYAFIKLINEIFDDDTSADRRNDTIAKVTWLFLEQKNSRRNEREADRLGMEWAMKAGYNPSGMVTLWENMENRYPYQRDLLTKMLSTHPPHKERSLNGRKLLKKWKIDFTETDFLTCGVTTASSEKQNIDGKFSKAGKNRRMKSQWTLSSGATIANYAGKEKSPCLQLYRKNTKDECTARSLPVKFNKYSAINLSASVKGYIKSSGSLWLGIEFFDKQKTATGVTFFAAQGISSIPGKWITFSRSFNEDGKNENLIPQDTHYCSVVAAGCEKIGERMWIDNIALSVRKLPGSHKTGSEGSMPPPRTRVRDNVLPNGSFENDMDGNLKPDRWTCSGGTSINCNRPSQGASSLVMKGHKQMRREFTISERIPVLSGSRYILEGMFKADKEIDVTFGVRLFSPDFRELKEGQDLQTHTISRNVWTIREQRVTVPSGEHETMYLQIWIRCIPEIGKSLYVDNVNLFYGDVQKIGALQKSAPFKKSRRQR